MKKNLKGAYKLPTRKEEKDFFNSLRPDQKQYWVKDTRIMPQLFPDFKLVHFTLWERFLRKIYKKGKWEE